MAIDIFKSDWPLSIYSLDLCTAQVGVDTILKLFFIKRRFIPACYVNLVV